MARKDEEKDEELNEDEESTGGDASSDESDAEASDSDESEAAAADEDEAEDDGAEDAGEDDAGEDAAESPEVHAKQREEAERASLEAEAKALAHNPAAETAVEQLGASARYVHAAFFVAGILVAFVSSKLLNVTQGALADWPAATRAVPLLLRFAEDERQSYSLTAGALIGLLAVIQVYRKENVRRWADEVALELTKVTWPSKETVTNGTIVVIVASMIATVYVTLLDRFWSFLTHLVYGA
ncbi:MAG: preprotein translocase subunit SecE [Polyangiaceae bacterium]